MFKRKIYQQMVEWKNLSKGRSALLIQGARRVGKSTVAQEFARREYKSFLLIDFSKARPEVVNLFKDMHDLDLFFLQLQMLCKVRLYLRESLIVFDEVQLQPLARQAIKHLVADGRYDYLETGSLITLRKNIDDILIPSEEECLHMFPLDYEEFLWARGDEATVPLLRERFQDRHGFGDSVHRKQMQDFRLYMLVGGMPQAVEALLEENDFARIDHVKRNILTLYENDFRKIDRSGRASQLFDAIPSELGKHSSRYQVSKVIRRQRAKNVRDIVADISDSMTVLPAFRVSDPGPGMSLGKDIDHFKLYLADTGLFVTLAFKDRAFTENIIYEKLLYGKLPANLGFLYENIVAQTFRAAGNDLFYHTFPSDTSNHFYEIDFLLARQHKICPVEVKSAAAKPHASLDRFRVKFKKHIAESYVICGRDYAEESGIKYVPFYLAHLL